MLLRWLLNVFPNDMRAGWRLIAPDLALWLAVAAALVLLAYVDPLLAGPQIPARSGGAATGDLWVAAGLLRRLVAPLVFVVAAVRFRALLESEPLSWSATAAVASRRLVPAALAWFAAAGLSLAGAIVAQVGALLMLRSGEETTDAMGAASMLVRSAVFVLLLARFAFVPYLAALHTGRELAPSDPYTMRIPRALYRAIWPLVESSRMTAGVQWRVLPYLVLGIYAPLAAAVTPSAVRPLVSLALHLCAFTALAVLFRYYAERIRELHPERAARAATAPALA